MKIKVDTFKFDKMVEKMVDDAKALPKEALAFFKKQTPIRSGNARRRTALQGNKINANYAYAQPLDEGRSEQSPDGMVEPTIEHIEKVLVPKLVRRAKNG
jgi:hypothetical protein